MNETKEKKNNEYDNRNKHLTEQDTNSGAFDAFDMGMYLWCLKEVLTKLFTNIYMRDHVTSHRLLKGRTGYCYARGLELRSEYEIGCIFKKFTVT